MKIVNFMAFFTLITPPHLHRSPPQQFCQLITAKFTFEGLLLDGVTPMSGDVTLTLDIYDPTGVCLLYEQQVGPLDLTAGKGFFSVGIGTTVGNSTRTAKDPGLSMDTVFANTGTSTRAAGSNNCAAGYLPNAGDSRNLQVNVTPSGGNPAFTMTPDIVIDSAPYATVAETLQGIAPGVSLSLAGNTFLTSGM